MEFSTLAKERFSVRKFSAKPVDEKLIQSILETALLAPSACNNQPTRYLVLKSEDSMEKLKTCTKYTFNAPMAIIVLADTTKSWVRPFDNDNYAEIDGSIAATHLHLAIHNAGLGSTWVGYFDPAVVRKTFAVPDNLLPVAIFPLGYPASDAKPAPQHSKRHQLAEIVTFEHF